MKTVKLPSGKELQISDAPFRDSRELYQAVLAEMKQLQVKGTDEVDWNMMKEMLCVGLSSKKIEACLEKCMERALYNGVRISDATWEPVEAREDYIQACFEVAKVNIMPFTKSLMQGLGTPLETLIGDLALRPKTPQS